MCNDYIVRLVWDQKTFLAYVLANCLTSKPHLFTLKFLKKVILLLFWNLIDIVARTHRPRENGLAWLRARVCTNGTFYKIGLFTFGVAKQPNLAESSLYSLFIRVSRDLWRTSLKIGWTSVIILLCTPEFLHFFRQWCCKMVVFNNRKIRSYKVAIFESRLNYLLKSTEN